MISTRWTAVVLVVSGVLLLTMGAAIVAAPVTLPLIYLGVNAHPTRLFRTFGGLLTALTVAEVAWAGVYLAVGESTPWIWLLPLVGGLAAIATYTRGPTDTKVPFVPHRPR